VRDLDRGHAGPVERLDDAGDVLDAHLMADRVHPVPQRHILDVKRLLCLRFHEAAFVWSPEYANDSATRNAAEVMMSRLPA